MENDGYVTSVPSAQNAINIFAEQWISGIPSNKNCTTGGSMPLFNDPRISYLINKIGGELSNYDLIELGSFECGHSYMLHQAGARGILGVEGSRKSFLKGLVIKEVFELNRLRLICGEIEAFLEHETASVDLLVASGVLYHFQDPLRALFNMTKLSPRIFLWTHYVDEAATLQDDTQVAPVDCEITSHTVGGVSCKYHLRSYMGAQNNLMFTGGVRATSIWMEKASIRESLELWGYDVEMVLEQPDHPNGPAACFFARRIDV